MRDPLSRPEVTQRLFLTLLCVGALWLVALLALPLWKPVLLAGVMAATVRGWSGRLSERLGGRRRLAAGLMSAAVLLLILLPLVVMITIAVRQALDATDWVRETMDRGGVAQLAAALPDGLERWVREGIDALPVDLDAVRERAMAGGWWAASGVASVLSALSTLGLQLVVMLLALYALLADGERFNAWLRGAIPLREQLLRDLGREFRRVSRSLINSNLLTGLAQTLVAVVGYLIAGVPQVLFFGLLTFLASFIPSVGTAVVAVPLAGLLILFDHVSGGVFLLIWSLVVVGLVDNILRPWLMRGAANLDGVVVFLSLIGGIVVFGPIGLVVGPLILTFFLSILRMWHQEVMGGALGLPALSPGSEPLPGDSAPGAADAAPSDANAAPPVAPGDVDGADVDAAEDAGDGRLRGA